VKITILASVSLLLVVNAQAEVYRWVDDDGRVHFGDQAPQSDQVEALDLPQSEAPKPTQSDEAFADAQRQRQQRITQVLEDERLAKEKIRADEQAKIEKRKKQCAKFSKRLSYYEPGTQFFEENDDGSRRYMSEAESSQYLSELQKQYNDHCTNG